MKKLFLVIIPVSFFISYSYAQNDVMFMEDFNDNNHSWWIGSWANPSDATDFIKAKVSGGRYIIESGKDGRLLYEPVPIDHDKDYRVETDIQLTQGSDNIYCGLFVGTPDYTDYLCFLISPVSQKFKVYGSVANKFFNYKDVTAATMNGKGSLNTLSIEKKNTTTLFYINGAVVYTQENLNMIGNKVGVQVDNNSIVEVDQFIIKQKQDPINLLEGQSSNFNKENLGGNINSEFADIEPVISPDGKLLFFARRDNPKLPEDGKYGCDDIWFSELQSDGTWSLAKKMPAPITDDHNNDLITISPDNNTLFLADTNCSPAKEISFWTSYRTGSGWSKPVRSKIKNSYNNSVYSEACFSTDGKTALLSLHRNDSKGEADIYVIQIGNNGVWSEPKNIGSAINSTGDEISPFIASDNVTMYFSTNGIRGYGENDIFVTKRLDDSWTNWSEPKNLGPTINTSGWEAYYCVQASGEYAYFNSTDETIGNLDIFRIKLQQNAKPNPVVLIKGKVLNSKTNKPVEASISYETLPSGKEIGTARSNPSTGEYKIILPYGESYGYHAKADGYIAVNENMELQDQKDYIEITKDLYLVPIEVGATIQLNNVFFVQSKADLLESSYPELDRLAKIMQDNPGMEIQIQGHTDNVGDADKNIKLSEDRVIVVKNYLISRGVEAKRITGKGFGGTKPIAKDNSSEEHMKNRRVEFVITKK
ncbi:MAG TPA: OmpA family protein [Cytophagaceae bacterium]|jgi:outer membrane protein OmpA-like peptidoglycan-associated protein|nr:OmpA family protein [Cytophagaceae bacterium]